MPKNDRKTIKLLSDRGIPLTCISHDDAQKLRAKGKGWAKEIASGRILSVQLYPFDVKPSNSKDTAATISTSEMKINAIAAADFKLHARKIDAFEVDVMEKVESFRPASWADRIRLEFA